MAVYKIAPIAFVAAFVFGVASALTVPKFAPIPESFKSEFKIDPVVEFPGPTKPKAWYASWPTSMRMTLLGKETVKNFKLICYTESSESASQLSSINFCFDGACSKLTSTGSETKTFTGKRGNKYTGTFTFSPSNGGAVSFKNIDYKTDMSFKFVCSVTNKLGTVTSNEIQIVDLRSRFPDFWTVTNEPTSSLSKNAPHVFKCLKNNVAPAPNDPPYYASWSYCTDPNVDFLRDCSSSPMIDIIKSSNWAAHVQANGDLFIPYFPDEVARLLLNRNLVCQLSQKKVAFYKNSLTFNDNKSPNEIKQLTMVRPSLVEKVKIFNSPSTRTFFPCNFKSGPGKVSVIWKFTPKYGSGEISITNTERNSQGYKISDRIQKQALHFDGPFSDATVGKYTCEVQWIPNSGGSNQVATGSYDVEILFFPTVSKKMAPLQYVADGDDGVVQCLFDGLKVTPSLAINGESISLKSEQAVDDSIRTVNNKFNLVMAGLNVKVTPYNPSPGSVITYTALKMAYKSTLNHLPSTHAVQCIGKNEVGSVRADTLLKVVPKPQLVAGKMPISLNCSECSAAEAHTIPCEVSNLGEINSSGIVFSRFWMLGKQRISDLLVSPNAPAHKYLVISSDSLTIKKIDDEDFKKQVNEFGSVECVLTLGYPPTVTKYPAKVPTSGIEKGLFFISSHTDMRKELTTPIKLTNIAPPTLKTGSMMWVIPVILALIVILIIIGVTYYCCRQRTSGEEYNVDAKEKQQGNDPEVEVAEKEAFPVFERPEDGPIRGSRASLDDSIHVGSDDEDEVLAEYDVDIGKFDEEGSFIGQYAVNDGTATGNRRLPPVGNNTEV